MALILKDRVKESSSSSGTGSITLGGAFPGYQTFNAAIATGSTVYYTIHNLTAGDDDEWEVGVGTFTSPATLSRDTVLSSSAGAPTKTNFTAGASGLEVFVTQPAEEAVYLNNATGKVEIGGNGTNTVTFTNINTTNLTATTVTLTNGTITTNAASATDITNKTYVDGLFSTGISYHDPVLVEEDVALDAVYVQPNGASNGVGATLTNNAANVALVVDGVSVSNTARILVYAQANAVQNGVYTVTNPGNASAQWVLTRATDADTFGLANPNTLGQGDAFFVTDGDTGAGRTYICNTPGTITFGSTNITFAEISSSQIYAAGTGLNLANLTFSLVTPVATTNGGTGLTSFTANAIPYASNTSTLATGSALTFDGTNLSTTGQVISTKTGSATTGAGQVYLNGSTSNRIDWAAVGTGAPAFTTRSDGTKVVLYPALSGSTTDYALGINSATLWSSVPEATAGFYFKWYGATTEVASLSGTGVFTATTGSFTNVSGNGVALTAINASNVTSGTLDNARTTGNTANSASTIVLRDANGSFGANIISGAFSGDGSAINAINASNISSGTIANARTSAASANGAATIVLRDGSGGFGAGDITALSISGNGVALSAINASNIASGTIDNARTSASSSNGASTIVLRGASGEFAAGAITGTSFSGNGSALTAINASSITTGTLDNARTTAATANGASTIVLRGTSGEFSAGIITADGSGLSAINASNISSGTIDNARTTAATANGASTIVLRDANGSFAGNVITGTTGTFTSVSGNGVALTAINASNISSGTVATARLGTGTANASTFLRGDQTYATVTSGITLTDDTTSNATRYVLLTSATSGTITTANVSSSKLTYNPSTGNLVATIHHSSSDERLKTDIQPIPDALIKISQINGVTYLRTDTPETVRHTGVIAQEVEAVLPEVVAIGLDGYKVVAYGNMIGLLVEAIKELKTEVDALKGK